MRTLQARAIEIRFLAGHPAPISANDPVGDLLIDPPPTYGSEGFGGQARLRAGMGYLGPQNLAHLPRSGVAARYDRESPPYKAERTCKGRNDSGGPGVKRRIAAGLEGSAAHPARPGKARKSRRRL